MRKSLDTSKMHGPPTEYTGTGICMKNSHTRMIVTASKIRHNVVKHPKYETEIER